MRALDIAGTGMQAQNTNVEVISNNIANLSTTGYKRQRAEFQDLMYQDLRRVGSNSSDTGSLVPSGAQIGLGVKTAAIYAIHEQGALAQTSNTLDMAIQGKGYFQITLPDGTTGYTRDGTFGMAADGTIVTADGFTVQPGLQIPTAATAITVNSCRLHNFRTRPVWRRRAATCCCRLLLRALRWPAIPASAVPVR
jgi:flagellar basal-body rod protein FlgG